MPTHSFTKAGEQGEVAYDVDFTIDFSGSPGSYFEPPEGAEITINSVATWAVATPDNVQTFEGRAIPEKLYEECEEHVHEHFDFNDWYSDPDDQY